MIALYAKVTIPHRGLTGRVTERIYVPRNGVVYRILIDTDDGSHTEALYGAASVRLAVERRGEVVEMPRGRPALRLAASDGVAL
jgi:hypothetical protein